ELPVADNIRRSSTTDNQGRFDLGPLPSGIYKLCPDETAKDDFEHFLPARPLPAAFLPSKVELSAASELEPIEIFPVLNSVTIEVHFVNSQGQPVQGNGFFLLGNMPDGTRVAFQRRQKAQESIVVFAPKGLQKAIIDFPTSSMRVRRAPNEPSS